MDTINEQIIKFSGKACIPEGLTLGNSYKVLIDGEITAITDSNNQDGTKNRIHKFEPILATITKDNGETIKTKDTRSWSTKLRKVIYAIWINNNSNITSEEYYEKVMKQILLDMDNITSKIQ